MLSRAVGLKLLVMLSRADELEETLTTFEKLSLCRADVVGLPATVSIKGAAGPLAVVKLCRILLAPPDCPASRRMGKPRVYSSVVVVVAERASETSKEVLLTRIAERNFGTERRLPATGCEGC